MRKAFWVVTGFWVAASLFVIATLSSIGGDAGRYVFGMATLALGLCVVIETLHSIGRKLDRLIGDEDERHDARQLGPGKPLSAQDHFRPTTTSSIYDE